MTAVLRPRPRPRRHVLHDPVHADVVHQLARLCAARQLHDVRHERGQLVQLLEDVGAQSLAVGHRQPLIVLERLDVRAQARDRGAQLVARVGHEVALRLDRALERVEGRVEGAREPPELVRTLGFDPLRGVAVCGQLLGAAREAGHGRERGPRHEGAEGRAERDSRRPDQQQHENDAVELAVHLVERASQLEGAASDPRRA